jgi:2-haloacid dehalogenase
MPLFYSYENQYNKRSPYDGVYFMPYRWLLFDADDTLFDYQAAEVKSLQQTFGYLNLPFSEEIVGEYRRINQSYWAQFEAGRIDISELRMRRFSDLFQRFAIQADAGAFSDRYLSSLGRMTDLLPGVLETLGRIDSTRAMAIITNGIAQVQRSRLSLSAIQPFFRHIFISEEIGASKPAAEFFDHVFKVIGDLGKGEPSKSDVLVIGDSLSSDMAGGIRYGLDTCWYNPHGLENTRGLPVTYQIQGMPQILEFI